MRSKYIVFVNKEKNEENDMKTIISDYNLTKQKCTSQYLHALNECCRLISKDPSAITTAKYWERNTLARKQHANLDSNTKEI